MKKIFLISGILLSLSSCSLFTSSPSSFEEYYARNATATIDAIDSSLQSIGVGRAYTTMGTLDAFINLPIILSGSFDTSYDARTDGKNTTITFKKPIVQYEGLTGSGYLSLDTLDLTTLGGDIFLRFLGLQDVGFSTDAIRGVFAKYDGKYLSWTQADARSNVTDPIELQALDLLENISKLTKKEIQEYTNTYKIFRSTKELGMSGSLQMYAIELDRDALIGLLDALKKDLTTTGFDVDDIAALQSSMADISITGEMGFHPKNTTESYISLNFADSEDTPLGTMILVLNEHNQSMSFSDASQSVSLNIVKTHSDNKDDLTLTVYESGMEMLKITAYIEYTGKKIREISLDATLQGVSILMRHTNMEKGNFEGRIMSPVGSMTWNGTIKDRQLSALKIQGASPIVGSIDMDLTPLDGMLRGPMIVRSGDQELLRANISLIAALHEMRLVLEIPQGDEDTTEMMRLGFGYTTKYSAFRGKITKPDDTMPLQSLFDDIEKIAPDIFTEDPYLYDDDLEMYTDPEFIVQ